MKFSTLPTKWQFVALAAVLYVTAPLVEAVYYRTQDERGAYPPNADSIGIPIFAFAVGVLILSPFYALAVWGAARSYRGGLSLLAFDRARPARAIFWSVTLGGLALYGVGSAVYSAVQVLPLDCLASLLWAYLLACLRSSLAGGEQSAEHRIA